MVGCSETPGRDSKLTGMHRLHKNDPGDLGLHPVRKDPHEKTAKNVQRGDRVLLSA